MKINRRAFLGYGGAALTAAWLAKRAPLTVSGNTSAHGIRVITLEYNLTEMVLQLGITPVGVADIKGYRRWVGFGDQLLARSLSVGTRQQPALEYIAALKPDLILGMAFRHQSILPLLESIAPTVLQADNHHQNGLAALQQNWFQVASAVNETAEAQSLWQQFEQSLNRLRHPNRNIPMTVLQGVAGTPTFWAFADNSIAGALAVHMGWQPSDILPPVAPQGIVSLDAGKLFDSRSYLSIITDQKRNITNGKIWAYVPAIQQHQYRFLTEKIWPFGGLHSSLQLAEHLNTVWK